MLRAIKKRLAPVADWTRQQGQRLAHFVLPPAADTDSPATPIPQEDLAFVPSTIAALFQQPPRPAMLVVRSSVIMLGIAFFWAACTRLDEITIGEGHVIPASQVQVVQNLEGGIIAEIPVHLGEVVQKGQVVVRLDETRFASSVGESKVKESALEAKVARLTAESTGAPFVLPPEVAKTDPQLASDVTTLYQNRQNELEATLGVLRQQVNQRSQEIAEKRARLTQLEESHKLIAQELKMSKPLLAQGVMSEVEILRIERQVADIRGEMDATRLAIPRLEGQYSEAKTKLEGALAKFRADAADELAKTKAELAGTGANSVALEDRLARTTVRAPLAGIVKSIKINTIGGVLQPGMDVMEIVPIEDNLLIEAKVKLADVGFLKPGQSALVKISAYDFSIYGGLEGKVDNISADAITTDKGESYYLVRIRTDKNYLGSTDKPLTIIPGMLATAHIRTGEKSVLSYLLKPIIKAKYEALRER